MAIPLIAAAHRIADHPDFSIFRAYMLTTLAEMAWSGITRASLPTLARKAKQSERQAWDSVRWLRKRGLIEVVSHPGQSSEYRMKFGSYDNGSGGGGDDAPPGGMQEYEPEPSHVMQASPLQDVLGQPEPSHPVRDHPRTPCETTLAHGARNPLKDSPSRFPSTGLRPAAAPPQPARRRDVRSELFSEGVALYRAMSGKSDAAARAAIGCFLRDARDDCARVLDALRRGADLRPADPFPWMRRASRQRPTTAEFVDEIMAGFEAGGPLLEGEIVH